MLRQLRTYLFIAAGWAVLPTCYAQSVDTHRLDSLILKSNRDHLPGFAVRVLQGNKVIYESQCGMANISRHLPMGQASIVNIGSVTKQFTAYGVYLLEERGLLNTSEEVHSYLPELPDFGHPITLRNLLSHTSGLRDYPDFISLLNQSSNHRLQYPELIEFLKSHRELNFPPGEQFCYSNTGYMLLARIIEVVSKQSYREFMQQEIFTPLEMTHTFVNEGVLNEQADGTTNYHLNSAKTKAWKNHPDRDVIGATCIFSNLEDLTKWNAWFYAHESGGKRSSVIAKMETSFTLNDGSACHYGAGLILKAYRGEPVIEHSGGWGEYMTQYRRFPKKGLTILVVTNSSLDSPFEICDKLSNALLTFNDKTVPGFLPVDALSLEAMNGIFISQDNIVRYVHPVSDSMQLRIFHMPKATAYNTYSLNAIETLADQTTGYFFADSAGNQLVFHLLPDGNGKQFIWYAGTYFQIRRTYSRIEAAPLTENRHDTGKYYSKELDRNVKVRYRRHKKQLVLVFSPLVNYKLKPIASDVFQLEGETYLIRFSETGFVLGNDWIYNIHFMRE